MKSLCNNFRVRLNKYRIKIILYTSIADKKQQKNITFTEALGQYNVPYRLLAGIYHGSSGCPIVAVGKQVVIPYDLDRPTAFLNPYVVQFKEIRLGI